MFDLSTAFLSAAEIKWEEFFLVNQIQPKS
jgi:hypothetical protein